MISLGVIRDIAAGLRELQRHAVIHRDVKPSNVLVTDGQAVLADFGVVHSRQFVEQTTTGAFFGTIRYAAPEYLFGDQYDDSIDLYSLGSIAYEAFTAREPFAEYRHWARVIGERVRLPEDREEPDLTGVAEDVGWPIAQFARHIIDYSRCQRPRRTLDLQSLIDAIDNQLWVNSYTIENGRFVAGLTAREKGFDSAELAAEELRRTLSYDEFEQLRALLKRLFWRRYIMKAEHAEASWLRRARVLVRVDRKTSWTRIHSAVREAFVRGYLDEPRSA